MHSLSSSFASCDKAPPTIVYRALMLNSAPVDLVISLCRLARVLCFARKETNISYIYAMTGRSVGYDNKPNIRVWLEALSCVDTVRRWALQWRREFLVNPAMAVHNQQFHGIFFCCLVLLKDKRIKEWHRRDSTVPLFPLFHQLEDCSRIMANP